MSTSRKPLAHYSSKRGRAATGEGSSTALREMLKQQKQRPKKDGARSRQPAKPGQSMPPGNRTQSK
jgi:hypothetical protein